MYFEKKEISILVIYSIILIFAVYKIVKATTSLIFYAFIVVAILTLLSLNKFVASFGKNDNSNSTNLGALKTSVNGLEDSDMRSRFTGSEWGKPPSVNITNRDDTGEIPEIMKPQKPFMSQILLQTLNERLMKEFQQAKSEILRKKYTYNNSESRPVPIYQKRCVGYTMYHDKNCVGGLNCCCGDAETPINNDVGC